MELEAKFTLPDATVFQQLQRTDRLAGYSLGAGQVEELRDTFLDTPDRLILSAGYYCRQREYAGSAGVWVTLKALAESAGAIHRRDELQISLPGALPPAQWPAGPLRERVLAWVGDAPLVPLFSLQQVRHVRPVLSAERPVAELSVDEVQLGAGGRKTSFLELEVELKGEGKEEDLAAIAAGLQAGWSLAPQRQSKFERGLALLEASSALPARAESNAKGGRAGGKGPSRADGQRFLTPAERAASEEIARRTDLHGRRARALLALDDGQTQEEAGRGAGMSERRVRYWLAGFRQKRLRVFPRRILSWVTALSGSPEAGPPAVSSAGGDAEVVEAPAARAPAPAPSAPQADVMTLLPAPEALEADDTMAQAARKTLALHFGRMLQQEAGVRLGQDSEAVHDMRVATRRMRAARLVFGAYLDADQVAVLAKDLRRAGRLLGTVRDMDVFREKAQHYLDSLAAEQRAGLDPLLNVWEARYRQARGKLLAYLDGERYARLKERVLRFIRATDVEATLALAEEPRPHHLRQVIPVAVYQGLAAVRAYEEWLARADAPLERYHQLRIASKGLRYTLEFFRDVLGPEAAVLVDRVKALQDHLGDLQDAVVACNLLRDFLTWGTWGRPARAEATWPAAPILAPGVAAYLAFRQTEIQRLVQTFPPVWEQVRGADFGRLLALCLGPLL